MPTDTRRWIIAEASEVCARIALPALSHGFAVALTGEVLFTGRGKQMDLLLVAVSPSADIAAAVLAIANELQVSNLVQMHSKQWQLFISSKQIGISIP